MNRSYYDSALVINLKPSGENNTTVTLLTKTKGIIFATLYGGPKSRLRSLVTLWNSGIIYLYEAQEKKQTKISDFDVKNYHTSFSQSLYKSYAANLACELCIKTRCAGSFEECWKLTSGFLDGLEIATEEQAQTGLLRFLWRFLELLGVQPATHVCAGCGKSFLSAGLTLQEKTYYNGIENKFICGECFSGGLGRSEHTFTLKLSALRYLAGITVLSPKEARQLLIDRQDYVQLKDIVFFLIENAAGSRLNTIETGAGIL